MRERDRSFRNSRNSQARKTRLATPSFHIDDDGGNEGLKAATSTKTVFRSSIPGNLQALLKIGNWRIVSTSNVFKASGVLS